MLCGSCIQPRNSLKFKLLAFGGKKTPFIDQKCTSEKVTKNLGMPPPPHLDKIQKNSNFFRETFPKAIHLELGCLLLTSAFWALALPNLFYALVRCPTGLPLSFVLGPLYWSYSWQWQPLIGGSILPRKMLWTRTAKFAHFSQHLPAFKRPAYKGHHPVLYFTAQVAEKYSSAKCYTHLHRCYFMINGWPLKYLIALSDLISFELRIPFGLFGKHNFESQILTDWAWRWLHTYCNRLR